MRKLQIVNCVNQALLPDLRSYLHREGFRIFVLNGTGIHDEEEFWLQTAKDLPCAQGLPPHSWDGFTDSMWFGLSELTDTRVAVLWASAQVMLHCDLQSFLDAVSCFEELARGVATTQEGFSHRMILQTFLIGEGRNFGMLQLST